jgi:hypothetical protein
LNVLAYAGKTLDDRQLVVEAYSPQDHKKSSGATYGTSPLELRLPAGTYDLRITGPAADASRLNVGADIEQWFTGVQIQPGETLVQEYNLRLGHAQVQVFEAIGKPADEKLVSFCIVPQGQRDCANRVVLVASGVNA